MTPKEEALKTILKKFMKKAIHANYVSIDPFCEQWIKDNRYLIDLMILLDESKSSKE